MLDSYLRAPYQRLLVDPLSSLPLPPIFVTLLGCFFGLLTIFPPLAPFALLISGYLDTLDGTLARKQKRTSPFGAALDILCDRIVESAIIIGLYTPERAPLCLAMLVAILLCVTSFLVVGIFSENQGQKSFHYSPGLIERTEAFLFFLTMMLLPSLFTILATLFTGLVLLTAGVRMAQSRLTTS